MSIQPELLRRTEQYCERYGLILVDRLGFGVHGSVFAVESQTERSQSAVKVHERERPYCRERDVYLRLKEWAVGGIRGFAVPEQLHHDDELWSIQMTVVTRPFVLDFAGAYLDEPPDFSAEVLAD